MQPTISFNLAGGPGVRITVVETADGKLQITAAVNAASSVGDLRGLFFHVADASLIGGLSVSGATSPVTTVQQASNAVNNLGSGVSIASATPPMDFGVAFGTSSIAGADDIRSVSFTLQHASEALTLADLHQMQFAAVLTSVGPATGPRLGVVRSVGTAPANAAPTAGDGNALVAEDGSVNGSVAGLASDPEGNALSFALVGPGVQGLAFGADGSWSYSPPADFNGGVQFQYRANDGSLSSNTGTVTITVTPVNDAPTDITLSNTSVPENSAVGTVVGNLAALDIDGGPATFSIIGTVPFAITGNQLVVNGALDFETQASYSVTVRADDGAGGTHDETFVIAVTDVVEGGGNQAPTANPASASVAEDGVLNASVSGSDPDSDPLTFAVATPPAVGTLVLQPNGSYTYTPPADFHGEVSFSFTASDGALTSAPATVTITVTPVNDAPSDITLSNNSVAENSAGGTVVGNLAAADIDGGAASFSIVGPAGPFAISGNQLVVNGALNFEAQPSYSVTIRADDGAGGTFDEMFTIDVTNVNEAPTANPGSASTDEDTPLAGTVSGSDPDSGTTLSYAVTTQPLHGTVVMQPNGAYVYTPPPDFNGPVSFQFTASDGALTSAPATVAITVVPVNDPPALVELSNNSVAENSSAGTLVGLLSTVDVDGGAPVYSLVGSPGPFELVGNELRVAGALNFEAQNGYLVIVQVSDGAGGSRQEHFTIVVTNVNEAPTANPGSASTDEDTPLAGTVTGTDPDAGTTLSYAVTTQPAQGTVVMQPDGSYLYTPPANFSGAASFQFTASDGALTSAPATVTITVNPVNDAPTDITLSDTSVPENSADGTVVGNLTAIDIDGGPATFAIVGPAVPFAIAGNQLVVNGALDFEAQSSYSVTVRANDGAGGTHDELFTIVVTDVNEGPGNQPPTANPASASVAEDGVLNGTVTGNDPNNDSLTFAVASGPAVGTLVLQPNGSYTYTPPADFNGDVSFSFTASDGQFTSAPATVSISVTPVNDAPSDITLSNNTVAENSAGGTVVGNLAAADIDGGAASFSIVGPAGPFAISGNQLVVAGALDFEAQPSYLVTIRANDGAGGTYDEAFTITVTDVNEAPSAPTGVSATIAEDSSTTFSTAQLLAGAVDPEGGPLTLQFDGGANLVGNYSGGVLTIGGAPNFHGSASASYRVFDNGGLFSTGTVQLTITPVNDAPAVAVGNWAGTEDTPRVFSIAALLAAVASDVDGDALSFVSANSVSGGTVGVSGDVLTFDPSANFNGLGWFWLTVQDPSGAQAGNWQYIDFAAVNDAPDAVNDNVTRAPSPQTITWASLFANDSDIDSPDTGWAITAIANTQGVTVAINPGPRTLTVTYDPGHSGAYRFDYTLADGQGGSDSATVTLNTAPQAQNDSDTIGENTAHADYHFVNVLGNDSDADGDSLTVTAVEALTPGVVADIVGNQVRYYIDDPANDTTGSFTLRYTVADGRGASAQAQVFITVTPEDDAPKPGNDFDATEIVSTGQFTPVTIPFATLLANDTHPDGTAFTITAVHNNHLGSAVLVDTDADTVNDAVRFTPLANQGNFFSYADSWLGYFYYTVTETPPTGPLTSAQAYAYVRVNDVNEAPVAGDDVIGRSGDPQVISFATLFANDQDYDSPPAGWTIAAIGNAAGVVVTVDNTARTVSVDYQSGFAGTYGFDYTLADGEGGSDIARVVLNTAPDAQDDAVTVDENAAFTTWQDVAVLANDSDADNDTLLISAIEVLGGAPVSAVGVGTALLRFHLTDPYFNSAFQIRYTASDGRGGSDSALLSVTVNPQNDAPYDPQGNDNALGASTAEDTALVIPIATLLGDDIDPEGNPFGLFDTSAFGGGTVSVPGNGTIVFTPNPNFIGASGFFYRTVDSNQAAGNWVSVPVTVTPVEDPPVAGDDFFGRSTAATQTLTFAQLLANDSDADNTNGSGADDDVLTITAVQAVSGGTVAISGNTVVFTFTSGLAVFDYTLSDGTSTDTGRVTLNGVPVAVDDALSIGENFLHSSGSSFDVVANDIDPNGDTLFLTGGVSVLGGVPVVAYRDATRIYFYSTDPDFNGTAEIEYTVTDGFNSDTGKLTLTVTPDNDGPRDPQGNDIALGLTTAEETPLVISIAALLADDVNPADEAQVAELFDIAFGSGGSIGFSGNGTLTFSPFTNVEGTAYFYYRAHDGIGGIGEYVYVPVTVTGTPDPIVANDDYVTRNGAGTQNVTAAQMKNNDVDPDAGDSKDITEVLAGNGIDGLVLNADDSVSVSFAASYSGRAFYDYTVFDGTGNGDVGRVFLNRAPVAVADGTITASESENYIFVPYATLLANDSDADGDTFNVINASAGSNISFVSLGWFEGGQAGLRAYLANGSYTGPADFSYRVRDGSSVTGAPSNFATVTLNVVAGNDAPVAEEDYWYLNGASTSDTDPATNPMAGVEDGVLLIPASLLIDGQHIGGVYQNGRDTDEENDALSIVAGSLFSFWGTVSLIDLSGVPTVRFEPFGNVNSGYPFPGFDSTRISFSYRVSDGARESNATNAFVYVAPADDAPVAEDDSFQVLSGAASYTLAFGELGGIYDVLANDSSPDDYPYDFWSGYSTITAVIAIGGATVSWNGYSALVTPDGSGDPIVLQYTLTDYDGDSDTALITLEERVIGPTQFYFSGTTLAAGRELWVYDPASYDELLLSPFATMVDEAETYPGSDSGNPEEITGVLSSVFWRGTRFVDFGEGTFVADRWHYHDPVLGYSDLGYEVGYGVFDGALAAEVQNLGVRAGANFWGASTIDGHSLIGWDTDGQQFEFVPLYGWDRHLLSDATGDPAYAAREFTDFYDTLGDYVESGDTEQLFGVLYNPDGGYWETVQVTTDGFHDGTGQRANDIREIAGLSVQVNPEPDAFESHAKVYFFTGDFYGGDGQFHPDALWQVVTTFDGFSWSEQRRADWLDNGSGGAVASAAYRLTVAKVPDGSGGEKERLFFFQDDALGAGQIATIETDYFGGSSGSTGHTPGDGFEGAQIKPWADGVVLSGVRQTASGPEAVVANWVDPEGDGFFFTTVVVMTRLDATVEHLQVDGAGNLAFVLDTGLVDEVWHFDGSVSWNVAAAFGEVTDLQLAGGTLAYIFDDGDQPRLYGYDLEDMNLIAVPTDEQSSTAPGSGFAGGYRHTALPDAFVFEAFDGFTYRLHVTDGSTLVATDLGGYSEGVLLGGDWVGTGYLHNSGVPAGLYRLAADGTVTTLHVDTTAGALFDAAVLGQQVLFGISNYAAVNSVLVFDATNGTTTPLLTNHRLGQAQTVPGGEVIFNALDVAAAAWKLYSWDGTGAAEELATLPASGMPIDNNPVYEQWRHRDFTASGDLLFWKQATAANGEEILVYDRSADSITVIDVNPGTASGGNWGDAVLAAGRFYFQASADGSAEGMRLWSTTDGSDAAPITGDALADGYQFPYLPQVIGERVYFQANSKPVGEGGSGTWAIFGLNANGLIGDTDDTEAERVSPQDMNFVYGLSAIDGELYFFAYDETAGADQMWRLTPGSGTPVMLTSFDSGGGFMADIFRGGDGNIYFGRDDASLAIGREMWVLDNGAAAGARLLADINTVEVPLGYEPQQLVAVPDPVASLWEWTSGGSGGGE